MYVYASGHRTGSLRGQRHPINRMSSGTDGRGQTCDRTFALPRTSAPWLGLGLNQRVTVLAMVGVKRLGLVSGVKSGLLWTELVLGLGFRLSYIRYLRNPFCIAVPNFAKIGQIVPEISRFL